MSGKHSVILTSNSLRPFYLPRELPQLFFFLFISTPEQKHLQLQNIKNLLDKYELISPDAPKLIMGDFNHCSVNKPLKGLHQYVNCSTHQGETLDKCYGSVPNAFRSVSLPPLGSSAHHRILLTPAYPPVVKRTEKVIRNIKQWTPESIKRLQGCLETNYWNIFTSSSSNISEHAETVSAYISFCVDNCIPIKKVVIFPNNKPWVTKDLKGILNKKKRFFFLWFRSRKEGGHQRGEASHNNCQAKKFKQN